jgi:two-component system LytT family sensor kinase
MLFVVYPLLLTFTIRYFQVQKVKLELVEQKKESELSLLRSQINPHFFFNTLNNIYALIYSGSPDAHLSVLKLSELMRYTLYKKKQREDSANGGN